MEGKVPVVVIITHFLLFQCSLFLSGTTLTAQGTRSWAWPDWLRMSWRRSLNNCCPIWRAEGLNPDPPCPLPPTPPQLRPLPQPPLLSPRNATCMPEIRAASRAFWKSEIWAKEDVYLCLFVLHGFKVGWQEPSQDSEDWFHSKLKETHTRGDQDLKIEKQKT